MKRFLTPEEALGHKKSKTAPASTPASCSASTTAPVPRKKPVTAKSLGLSKDDFDRVKLPQYKKALKGLVKTLAQQVDNDWHDGYEEQGETIDAWFASLKAPLQAVLDIGVGKAAALHHCNEILKTCADSWADLCCCP